SASGLLPRFCRHTLSRLALAPLGSLLSSRSSVWLVSSWHPYLSVRQHVSANHPFTSPGYPLWASQCFWWRLRRHTLSFLFSEASVGSALPCLPFLPCRSWRPSLHRQFVVEFL